MDEARAQLAQAQMLLTECEDWGGLPGGLALAEGLVRAAEDRWGEAESAFRRAVAVSQQYELRWDEAKVYFEWANALIGREPEKLDLQKRLMTQGLLGRATALWEPMGALPYAERCRQKLAELG